jgi:hypothetical protein
MGVDKRHQYRCQATIIDAQWHPCIGNGWAGKSFGCLGGLVSPPEDDVVQEGEVLHVAVYALEQAVLEDRKPDVQDTVLVLGVLNDQEEAEVARLKRIIVIARDVTYVADGNHYNDDNVDVDRDSDLSIV